MWTEALEIAAIWAVPIILAITLHEAAHGYVAWRLGDDTAYRRGRVTFNPIRHIDPVGTLLLPGAMLVAFGAAFGWAKPVPINVRRLPQPRRDVMLVALAGPVMNIALALVSAALVPLAALLPASAATLVAQSLMASILINLILALFNMMPVPPLDGGRVAVCLLPQPLASWWARLERWGLFIVVGLFLVLPYLLREMGQDFNPLTTLVFEPALSGADLLLRLVGAR